MNRIKHHDKRPSWLVKILLEVSEKLALAENLHEGIEILNGLMEKYLHSNRSAVFLINEVTNELFSRIKNKQGQLIEIQIYKNRGIAGWVYTKNRSAICNNPYGDDRFEKKVDEQTGIKTRNILCVPIRTLQGKLIGVAEVINKTSGEYNEDDLGLLEAITEQATIVLNNLISEEVFAKTQASHAEFMEIVSSIASELELTALLKKTMSAISHLLDAERSTLFVHDEAKCQLYTIVGEGINKNEIRINDNAGIAGTVFRSKKILNIPHPYADLRFNPDVDKTTGFFTRSILCVPVINKQGKVIGVAQVLNKRTGRFNSEDEKRLEAFATQISMAIENAMLFDEVIQARDYNDKILTSMSNGLISVDGNGFIVSCNRAARSMMKARESDLLHRPIDEFFVGEVNRWVVDAIRSEESKAEFVEAELEFKGTRYTVNLSISPITDGAKEDSASGVLILIEDMTNEKRMMSTMSRYMDPGLVAKLLKEEGNLGGKSSVGTILFSDIRSFTTITEELGPQGTVSLLNEYFTDMVDVITDSGGMLDKFIGDAIMAVFGAPFPHEDDPERALSAAILMMSKLNDFNRNRAMHGLLTIDHGIGLNTGIILSGNIGSNKRMDYTVIGDGVNLAARLESACKQYGAHILISEYTHEKCLSCHTYRDIDLAVVKGKTQPVRVYEVLDYHDENSFPHMKEVLGIFEEGIDKYREGLFSDAKKAFSECLKLNKNDKASELYLNRCKHLENHPPLEEWNGVWVMKTK